MSPGSRVAALSLKPAARGSVPLPGRRAPSGRGAPTFASPSCAHHPGHLGTRRGPHGGPATSQPICAVRRMGPRPSRRKLSLIAVCSWRRKMLGSGDGSTFRARAPPARPARSPQRRSSCPAAGSRLRPDHSQASRALVRHGDTSNRWDRRTRWARDALAAAARYTVTTRPSRDAPRESLPPPVRPAGRGPTGTELSPSASCAPASCREDRAGPSRRRARSRTKSA